MKSSTSVKRLISTSEVYSLTSLSRATLWHDIKSDEFPKPVKLSDDGIRKAFVLSEIWASTDQHISQHDQQVSA
ncbi:putative DNA-binding transcriptional regulator AlpA [Rhizobium sp. BK619]|uniref:helix-turn-helix transcriptional regulator n=1 Tax=Rhizobium sp. BK619 TaxID=2586989 RepID=UPI00161AF295|nr:AlpA family phage regulatory protein [Rhizobium sp. BK619]MBB3645613.1 putative DNA-binding transcriptional regulator AlpA [Rhizobium sp. BK619]